MRTALAALLLVPTMAAADAYERQPRVLDLFSATLSGARPGPAGEGSAQRTLEGADSQGRYCRATVDVRAPARVHGRIERGWPERGRILVVQIETGRTPGAYAGSALFPPGPSRDGGADRWMHPVKTEVMASRVLHEETDSLTRKTTMLEFSGGRLVEFRQLVSDNGTGRENTIDCLGLREM